MNFPMTSRTASLLVLSLSFLIPNVGCEQNATGTSVGPWTNWSSAGLNDYEAIVQVINLEAIAVDTKTWSLLSQVYTEDVYASYFDYQQVVGLAALTNFSIISLEGSIAQHLQGTHMVQIGDDGCSANATTYARATIFPNPEKTPPRVIFYTGWYNDQLVKTNQGWRIKNRLFRFFEPGIVNITTYD